MAATYKRLGASSPSATTNTTLYTVPTDTQTVISSLSIANRSSVEISVRVAHVDGAIGSVSNEDYIYYDLPIPANDTFIATLGVSMEASDTLMVYSDTADASFVAWGSEVV